MPELLWIVLLGFNIVHPMSTTHILLYCRPGFEKECASEIMDKTAQSGLTGYVNAKPDAGYVLFHSHSDSSITDLNQVFHYSDFIFARQCVFNFCFIKDLPNDDRVSPLIDEVKKSGLSFLMSGWKRQTPMKANNSVLFVKNFQHLLQKH